MINYQLVIVFFLLIGAKSFSQITFEKGYIVNEAGQKTECFIKNVEWAYNPTEFEYRVTTNGNILKANTQNIKEFGVYDAFKYIRAAVKFDISSNDLDDLSKNKNPIFEEKVLFLKAILEGKASLYQYKSGKWTRYFFRMDGSEIEQLIYKRYYTAHNNIIAENNHYKNQLLNTLKCDAISESDLIRLRHSQKDLQKVFVKYNGCVNSDTVSYGLGGKKDVFNLSIRPGINWSSLSTINILNNDFNVDFGQKTNFRLGIEAEYILPFNKNKWSLSVEPTYHRYESEASRDNYNVLGLESMTEASVEYTSIEVPLTLRHYFFLGKNSSVFVNLSFVMNLENNSTMDYEIFPTVGVGSRKVSYEIKSRDNLAYGIGFKSHNILMEIRYFDSRNLLFGYSGRFAGYEALSVIVGYTIF